MTRTDVIDSILGPHSAAAVSLLRGEKPELAAQMQDYYNAVFEPAPDSAQALSPAERWLIAVRTASRTKSAIVVEWYSEQALRSGVDTDAIAKTADSALPWVGEPRMTAIMRHVDLIVSHPGDSSRADIDALLNAGLTPAAIVALSQVVAYVSYQLRLIAAFRALGDGR
jgi:uncharacterized protein YciW